MKSKSTIRRSMLATLLVFATAALGLQPLVFKSGSGCECNATDTSEVQSAVTKTSCCASQVPEQEQNCCAAKPVVSIVQTPTKGCCCNPEATFCKCGDCKCSLEDKDSIPASPAIPTNETTEVVSPVLVCAAPFVAYPRETGKRQFSYPRSEVEFAALSSQQTCVLLSRFTC